MTFEVSIRVGTAADVLGCTAVWQATVDEALPAPEVGYHLYQHEIDTGSLLVAERDGEVVGFAGSIVRGERWFLADLFVSPDLHGGNVGRRLFDALLEADDAGPIRCTMASSDHRALALYTRAGMSPQWPCFSLTTRGGRLGRLEGVASMHAHVVDGDTLLGVADRVGYALDARDVDYWRRHLDSTNVVVDDPAGRAVGGAVVRPATPFAIGDPTAVSLGPVFAETSEHLADVLAAVLGFVEAHTSPDRSVRLFVPGPSRLLPALLHAGFRIDDLDFFSASRPDLLDPHRVCPSHDLL